MTLGHPDFKLLVCGFVFLILGLTDDSWIVFIIGVVSGSMLIGWWIGCRDVKYFETGGEPR